MKIKTQARLLTAGILAVPLLIILTLIIYRIFLYVDVVPGLLAYENVSSLMEEHFNPDDLDSVIRNIVRFRNLGSITIFRSDLLVLYSEIPEFKPDDYTSWEEIMPMLESQQLIFTSQGLEGNKGYVLIKLNLKDRMAPIFLPAYTGIIIAVILIIVAVCGSIIITRTITYSVEILEDATRRIAEGELDIKVDVKGSNEIISLTNSLNKVRHALKEEELRRSRFIMGITHDLKTPLALIKGYAEVIEDGITGDTISYSDAAQTITDKADQLECMIDDLIDFVKMDSGEWRGQLNKVNLAVFFRNAVKLWSMDIDVLRHEIISDINLPENIFVSLDEKLIHRAIENLIYNAVRYTPAGSLIRFAASLSDNIAELVISDSGHGIEKEDLPHIFEMFYRASSSRDEQGIGLGLAVVKWVIDYHGWSITATSEKGKGTSFCILIPILES